MHDACHAFLRRTKAAHPEIFKGKILEAGSLDVNGNPRGYFQASEYIGLDWRPGPAVDAIGLIHQWTGHPYGYFDTVISTETLEHDPHWRASLSAMMKFVKLRGSLIITCAGPGRAPHYIETSPTGSYYENRTFMEIFGVIGGGSISSFDRFEGEYDDVAYDTRVLAVGKR